MVYPERLMKQSWKSSNINTSVRVFLGSYVPAVTQRLTVEMLTLQATAVLSYGAVREIINSPVPFSCQKNQKLFL
jgi:hypothetical protein